MSRISSSQPIQTAARSGTNDINDLDVDQFLQLMITELQNQDPLDPMDNNQILQQINTIREISATDQLATTLESVLTGQNLSTASSLIGKTIQALSDENENITGIVDRVSVALEGEGDQEQRTLRVHVGAHAVDLKNIREIATQEGETAPVAE